MIFPKSVYGVDMNERLEWVAVAEEHDLPADGRLVVTLSGLSILLLKLDGQVYAVGNHCPHLGCSMARGQVEGFLIVCPCHDWTFDIRTGEFIMAREITLPVYSARIDMQQIYIKTEKSGVSNG